MKMFSAIRLLVLICMCSLSLSACGSSESSRDYSMPSDNSAGMAGDSYSYDEYSDADPVEMEADEAAYEEASGIESKASEGNDTGSIADIDNNTPGIDSKKIVKDKLIYTCNLSIDTLDFEDSVKKLSKLIEKNDGFIETEEYSDGSSYDYYNYYYVDDEDKHNLYSATIRIPSDRYDVFLNDAESLGDVRSQNARVDNVSQEYTDLNVSLEIYEAAYDRYMKLLSETTDDEYALKLQQEITDTQIEIARIKTRLNKIDTDVAYSFVNIDIREVTKYDAKPLPKDTFAQRLMSEVQDTFSGFLDFLEGLLFLAIHLAPYIVLLAVVVIIIKSIRRKMGKQPIKEVWKAKREENARKREEKKRARLQAKTWINPNNNLSDGQDNQQQKGDDQ